MCARAGAGVSIVIKDLIVLEAPGFNDVGVGIIGLDEIILAILLVEEEDLGLWLGLLYWHSGTSP